MQSNKRLIVLAGVIISLFFLWFAFRNLNPQAVWSHIVNANALWLVMGVAIFFASMALIAWRWQFLLRAIQPVPLGALWQLVAIGYTGNNVYPFRTGEILRIFLLRRSHHVPAAKTTMTIIVERVFDGMVMLSFIILSLRFVDIPSPQIQTMANIGTPLFVAAVIVFFVLAARPRLMLRLAEIVTSVLPEKLRAPVMRLSEDIVGGLAGLRSPADLFGSVFASYASWGVHAFVYWAVALAFGINVSFMVMLLAVGVVNLAGLIPATPGQVGIFEFFTGLVLTSAGVDADRANAYALVLHVVIWLPVTLLGFYYLVRQGLGWSAITSARAMEQETIP
jgi:glycosyltransferase 2 family protein